MCGTGGERVMHPNAERFWSKVDIGDPTECWEWLASTDTSGYGRFQVHKRRRQAHRVAWALTFGPIPDGLFVCHKCDNRACCNPYHLFLGTNVNNLQDAARKGYLAQKLTRKDVLAIRDLWTTNDYTQQELADEFGVSQRLVHNIVHGKCWRWLKGGDLP